MSKREWKVIHNSGKLIGFFGSPEAAKKIINKKFDGSTAFLIKEVKKR